MGEHRRLGDLSLAELTARLSHDAAQLVRCELALARAETAERAGRLGGGAALVGLAGVCVVATLACLVTAAIAALALVVDVWLAAVIVAVALAVLGTVLGLIGVAVMKRTGPPVPKDAVESAKEDVEWLRTHVRSGSRSSAPGPSSERPSRSSPTV